MTDQTVRVPRAELEDFAHVIGNLISELSDPGTGALAAQYRINAMLAAAPSPESEGAGGIADILANVFDRDNNEPDYPAFVALCKETEARILASLQRPQTTAPDSGDETYEIGKRDGYESAVQDIDLATGGDGEFQWSSDPAGCVDVPIMRQRIIDRLQPAPDSGLVDRLVEALEGAQAIAARLDDHDEGVMADEIKAIDEALAQARKGAA